MRRRLPALEALFLAGCLCVSGQTPRADSAPSVPSAECAIYHPKIVATYARTGMARSFSRLDPVTARLYHKPSATWYSMESRGAKSFSDDGASGSMAKRPTPQTPASIMRWVQATMPELICTARNGASA